MRTFYTNIYSLCCPPIPQFMSLKKNRALKAYSLSCFLNAKLFSQCHFITPVPEKYSKLSYKKIFWILLWSENQKKQNKIKKKSRLPMLWRKAVFCKAPVTMPSMIWHDSTVQKQRCAPRGLPQGIVCTHCKSMRGDSPNLAEEINLQPCCQAEYTYILAQRCIFR